MTQLFCSSLLKRSVHTDIDGFCPISTDLGRIRKIWTGHLVRNRFLISYSKINNIVHIQWFNLFCFARLFVCSLVVISDIQNILANIYIVLFFWVFHLSVHKLGVNCVNESTKHAGYSNVALKCYVNNLNVTPQIMIDKDYCVNFVVTIVSEHRRKIPNKMSKSLQEIQRAACWAIWANSSSALHTSHYFDCFPTYLNNVWQS